MKAPDKTFPLSVVGDLLASTSPEEVVFMPDKMYFDGVDTSTTPRLAINEEYIRKDALLEWAKQKQYESLTIVADDFWQEVIEKINKL